MRQRTIRYRVHLFLQTAHWNLSTVLTNRTACTILQRLYCKTLYWVYSKSNNRTLTLQSYRFFYVKAVDKRYSYIFFLHLDHHDPASERRQLSVHLAESTNHKGKYSLYQLTGSKAMTQQQRWSPEKSHFLKSVKWQTKWLVQKTLVRLCKNNSAS